MSSPDITVWVGVSLRFSFKNAFHFYRGNIMPSVIKFKKIYDFISNVPPCQ